MRRSPIRLRSTPQPETTAAAVVYRAAASVPEIRGDRRLCFYAAVFDVRSRTLTDVPGRGPYQEILRPGAFSASLARGADVYACLEHDPSKAFSRRSQGLLLEEDGRGLFASCYLPPSPFNDEVLNQVRERKLSGCSFGFRSRQERESRTADGLLVEQLIVDLVDVALTRQPAYPGTVVSVRADVGSENRSRRLRLLKLRGT
jgi:uncharacterized protein